MIIRIENRSKSNPTRPPYVTQYDTETGAATCDCPGWINQRPGKPRECKHTKDAQAQAGSFRPTTTTMPSAPVAPVAPKKCDACREFFDRLRYQCRRLLGECDCPKCQGLCSCGRADAPVAPRLAVDPMLASAMTKAQSLDAFTNDAWVLEEKYDGHRMIVEVADGKVRATSRRGNGRTLPVQITRCLAVMPNGAYDGELCVPGGKSSDVARLENAGRLGLVLFDVVRVMGNDTTRFTYDERRALLVMAHNHIAANGLPANAVMLSAVEPVSREAVERIWDRGGEGAILKRRSSTYQPGARSADWVKVKQLGAATVTIRGFRDGDTGIKNGRAVVANGDGREFTIKVLNNATLAAVAKNPADFVGQRLVISYTEKLPSGAYRHPRWDHLAGDGE